MAIFFLARIIEGLANWRFKILLIFDGFTNLKGIGLFSNFQIKDINKFLISSLTPKAYLSQFT